METVLKFDPDDLTIGQLEFISDYTGRSADEMVELFESKNYFGKDLVAVIAVAYNPEDPASVIDEVRSMKATDIEHELVAVDDPEEVITDVPEDN